VEDGSYFRAKTIQIGYNFSPSLLSNIGVGSARVYLQGQNLFTISDYRGPDPDINIQGDDLIMGVDRGSFPGLRQFILGVSISL